ncbi:MAG: YcgN family cysteine cluster protein [Rickettsiales bacterium]|nr:YcgN family cysteine cluster protein [Rickettsiales bacterium]
MPGTAPFWKTKTMAEMSKQEWESLCDGCGLCCLIRVLDEDSGDTAITNVGCRYLNTDTCRCTDYQNRKKNVPDCIVLTPEKVEDYEWLPETCAYRLVKRGEDLPFWHPLQSGNPSSVHEAGISMQGSIVLEDEIDDIEDHIVGWLEQQAYEMLYNDHDYDHSDNDNKD